MIKAILFDLDDTLYSHNEFRKSGFKEVSIRVEEEFGIRGDEAFELLLSIMKEKGSRYGYVFDEMLQRLGKEPDRDFILELVKIFRNHPPKIRLYQDFKEILPKIKKYNLGIITDGLRDMQRRKICSLGIERLFDPIIYTEEYGCCKPSPIPYKIALNKLEINGCEAMYIGDDPSKDFIGAKKLGIRTVRLMRGECKGMEVDKEYDAEEKIQSFNELEFLIE